MQRHKLGTLKPKKPAPKKLVAKSGGKKRSSAKKPPRRQMTLEMIEKRAVGTVDGKPFDGVAFIRSLR